MINDMRRLALSKLNHEFQPDHYLEIDELRQRYASEIAQYLVEASEKVDKVYLLIPESTGKVRLSDYQLDEEKRKRLPFAKPSGAQSPAIGPVIKRTSKKEGGVSSFGPSPKILNSTLKEFEKLAKTESPWQNYFQEIVAILNRKELSYQGNDYSIDENSNILIKAVELIKEQKTVFVAVATLKDDQEFWPGDRSEYQQYLAHELAHAKYVTQETPPKDHCTCSLCGKPETTIYPNGVKGAGINISNADREGSFSGIDAASAWKNYGLCLNCADLLFIFKNHLLPQFFAKVAGDNALVLPSLLGNIEDDADFMQQWYKYLKQINEGQLKRDVETDLLEEFFMEQDDAHLLIHIIWANFGQNMENISGYITDILPSRLKKLNAVNAIFNQWQHALTPRYPIEAAKFNLHLEMLLPLLWRPGGKKAKKSNESKQLHELKQRLVEAIYHGQPLRDQGTQLWYEIITTAKWQLNDLTQRKKFNELYDEGFNSKKNESYWTLAGWMRHLARFLSYLHETGVLRMEDPKRKFDPNMPALKPFFEEGSGITTDEKAKEVGRKIKEVPLLRNFSTKMSYFPNFNNKVRTVLISLS